MKKIVIVSLAVPVGTIMLGIFWHFWSFLMILGDIHQVNMMQEIGDRIVNAGLILLLLSILANSVFAALRFIIRKI